MFKVLGVKMGLNLLARVCGNYWQLYHSDWHSRKLENKPRSLLMLCIRAMSATRFCCTISCNALCKACVSATVKATCYMK